jgi:hypothetical protein
MNSGYTRAREYQIPSRLATQHDPAVAGAWLWKSRLRPASPLLPGRIEFANPTGEARETSNLFGERAPR